jgi:hypothetical protein
MNTRFYPQFFLMTGGYMKRTFGTSLGVLLLTAFLGPARAQIPNPGFETWSGVVGSETPAGWVTGNIPGFVVPITKTAAAHSGALALQGNVVNIAGIGLYPPYFWAHFPYTQRPGALTGYYKFTSVSKDSLDMFVYLYRQSLSVLVASGEIGSTANLTAFTKFSIPLEYFSTENPDTAWFEVTILNGLNDTLHLGTGYVFDDLAFEGTATAVGESQVKPTSFALEQNYPNPFNPETAIRYDLPGAAKVRLSVYNPLGQEVATLVNEQEPAGSYQVRFNASTMPSGMYFYRLEAVALSPGIPAGSGRTGGSGGAGESFVQTRRLVILK